MYQSMFLLGVIAFGVFSYTFNVYTDRAEELTYESNIDLTNQKVGTLLLEIISQGQDMGSHSQDFEITIYVYLDSTFARRSYYLEIAIDVSNEVLLNAYSSGEQISSFNTGYIDGATINFDSTQIMVSENTGQYIFYESVAGIATVGFASG